MIRMIRPVALAAGLAMLMLPGMARAQGTSTDPHTTPHLAPHVLPHLQPHVAPHAPAAPSPVAAAPAAATRRTADVTTREAAAQAAARQLGNTRGDGKVYMIVGGAAFVAGALIGGDVGTIVMLGGAGLGIYGLYLWVR